MGSDIAVDVGPAFRPDVVLCDPGLPGADGYEVAKRFRALPQFERVLICALTGFTPSEADRDRPRQAGFDHRVIKPVALDKLLALLETVN